MKKLNSKLFSTPSLLSNEMMTKIYGGAKTSWSSSSGTKGTDTTTEGGKDAVAD